MIRREVTVVGNGRIRIVHELLILLSGGFCIFWAGAMGLSEEVLVAEGNLETLAAEYSAVGEKDCFHTPPPECCWELGLCQLRLKGIFWVLLLLFQIEGHVPFDSRRPTVVSGGLFVQGC